MLSQRLQLLVHGVGDYGNKECVSNASYMHCVLIS